MDASKEASEEERVGEEQRRRAGHLREVCREWGTGGAVVRKVGRAAPGALTLRRATPSLTRTGSSTWPTGTRSGGNRALDGSSILTAKGPNDLPPPGRS
jgi:hypothetical protein